MKHEFYIGVDIGGTNIACGVVNEQGEIVLKKSIKTECKNGYESVVKRAAALVDDVINEADVEVMGVGAGCPGGINKETGVVEKSGNLGWYNVPLQKDLESLLRRSVVVDNDANAAAYGEFVAGVAKEANSAVVITLGTGVGSGIIIDGKLYYGENFAGGEIGHIVIDVNGVPCSCGRSGCFETLSSATGLIRMSRDAMEANPDTKMHAIAEECGKVSARTAWKAKELGDKVGTELVERYIKYLACGITNVINIFQPDIVCIGGGVCNEGDNLLIPLKKLVGAEVFSRQSDKNSEIAICKLGNDAGIIGAGMLSRDCQYKL
jgi:glucokinase